MAKETWYMAEELPLLRLVSHDCSSRSLYDKTTCHKQMYDETTCHQESQSVTLLLLRLSKTSNPPSPSPPPLKLLKL